MVNIPAQYQADVDAAAKYTGLPVSVVASQINDESGFNPSAVSPTGAEGIAQFEPGTWASWGQGSPFDPQQAFIAYERFMKSLLNQNHGNVEDALAAYNAGEGNLSAGMGYARTILANAGQPVNVTAGGGTGSGNNNGSGSPNLIPGWLQGILGIFPGGEGVTALGELADPVNWVNWAERIALMLFGGILIIIGIIKLTGSPGVTVINQAEKQSSDQADSKSAKVNSPAADSAKATAGSEAAETAEVAAVAA